MKRLTLALGIIITMALTVMAQGVDGIKRNSSYLYGEGEGSRTCRFDSEDFGHGP